VSRKTEIEVGITVLVAVAILIGGMAWLKDYSLHHSKRTWQVVFPQTGGLAASDEVLVNGIRKGDVTRMRLVGDKVIVELSLDRDITITRDSQVAIQNVGLMGEKVIAVDLKTTGAPYTTRDLIPGIYEKGLGEVMGQIGQSVDAVAALSEELRQVVTLLNKDGKLVNAVQNFSRTSEEMRLAVSENRAALREAIRNIDAASRTAKSLTTDREGQLRQALDNFASAADKMDQLSGRLDSLRAVIHTTTSRVERGEGTLGKLIKDDQLYAELHDSVQSLKELIEDIRAHPKKYLKISFF